MVRPVATGLATAFFRLYVLDSLASAGPARPASLLATVAREGLPFSTGAFSRALQSLLEGGHLVPADGGCVALTALGAAERDEERARWSAVIPAAERMIGVTPRNEPTATVVEEPAFDYRAAQAAETYLDRVLMTAVRERVAIARDGGSSFAIVLARLDLAHPKPATRKAMLHRAVRATLGGTSALLGGDADAYRWGEAGVAALAPLSGDPRRGERMAAMLELRLEELARTMTASVRSFAGARWRARSASATWSPDLATSGALLNVAVEALDARTEPAEAA